MIYWLVLNMYVVLEAVDSDQWASVAYKFCIYKCILRSFCQSIDKYIVRQLDLTKRKALECFSLFRSA